LSGTWGDVVNDNITQMVEQAIAGKATVNSWTGNSHTLTTADGTTSESRCAILELTDSGTALTGAGTVVCPTNTKLYIVDNNTAEIVTVKTSGGTGVAVPVGKTMLVYCDGTNVVEGVTHANSLSLGTSTVTADKILDEDNMTSDSATAIATQQSIKAYVDSQVGSFDTLAEVLAQGNTTGGTDLAVSTGDDITFADSSKAIFGAGSDLEIYHDGSNSIINDAGTGTIRIQTAGVNQWEFNGLNFKGNDGRTIVLGDSSDLQIYHDGSNSWVSDQGTGQLILESGGAGVYIQKGATETMANFIVDGAVSLYHDNVKKFETASGGVAVTGTVTADGLTVDGDGLLYSASNVEMRGDANVRISLGTAGTSGANNNSNWIYGNGTNLRFNNAGGFYSWENLGVEQMRIDTSGKVGIGVTPATTLDVKGSSDLVASFRSSTNDGNTSEAKIRAVDSDSSHVATFLFQGYEHRFQNASGVEQMRIDSSGNVGIGTDSPAYKLDVQGGAVSAGNGTIKTGISYDTVGRLGTFSNHALKLITNNTEAMRIDASGYVAIGTSSTGFNGQGLPLVVGSGTGSTGMTIFSGADSYGTLQFADAVTTGAASYAGVVSYNHTSNFMYFSTASTERMRIDASGNLLVDTTSATLYSSTSETGINLAPDGGLYVAADGTALPNFNRVGSDGDIMRFRKDGAPVGSIGSYSGDLWIGQGNTGLLFNDGGDVIRSANAAGGNRDGVCDLGASDSRFKDLYLSGQVQASYIYRSGADGSGLHFTTDAIYPTNETSAISDGTETLGAPAYRFKDLYLSGGVRGTSTIDITIPETSGGAIQLEFGNNVNDTRRTVRAYKDNFEPAAADTGVISLGQAANKWKDLHLSGGVVFGDAGGSGTSSSNTLDSYEEGTFTATLKGSTGEPATLITTTARYTKVGNTVFITVSFENINTTGYSGQITVTGVPFASNNSTRAQLSVGHYQTTTWNTGEIPVAQLGNSSTTVIFQNTVSGSVWAGNTHNAGTARFMWVTGAYIAA